MDTLKLFLWLAVVAVAVLQVYSDGSVLEGGGGGEGNGGGGGGGGGGGKKKDCVPGPPRDCSVNGIALTCTGHQSEAENGGKPCPDEVSIPDPNAPDNLNGNGCILGPWSACFPLPGFPWILVTRRYPTNPDPDISACGVMIMSCNSWPVPCVMSQWSIWYNFPTQNLKVRVRFVILPPQHGGTPCPHDIEACQFSPWGPWLPYYTGFCRRIRTATGFPTSTVCQPLSQILPCSQASTQAPCIWLPWGPWSIYTRHPNCTQIRWRRRSAPCPPNWQSETRPCLAACQSAGPAPLTDVDGVLEAPSDGGDRRKRDVPWCREETYIIWGLNNGCRAVNNATWYKCIHQNCENCNPPPGTGLICIPHKITRLIIPLTCPVAPFTRTVTVFRPQACTCHRVVNTCSKFLGPCA